MQSSRHVGMARGCARVRVGGVPSAGRVFAAHIPYKATPAMTGIMQGGYPRNKHPLTRHVTTCAQLYT